MLELKEVTAGYGGTTVIEDIDISLAQGEVVALLGRNGVGKTTLLATIMGHTRLHRGAILFEGQDLVSVPIFERARRGIGYVPEEREIFPSLTVRENLLSMARKGFWDLDRILNVFPGLAVRLSNMGNQLSGGEQQMLSVARALMLNPRILLLDEPLEGLAPVVADQLLAAISAVREADGLGIVIVEQQVRLALEFAPKAFVLERGRTSYDGDSKTLLADSDTMARVLGVSLAATLEADA